MFPFFRKSSRLQVLIKAIDARPPDQDMLAELQNELAGKHTALPVNALWQILDRADKALTEVQNEATKGVIEEIRRSANWELGSRNRAT